MTEFAVRPDRPDVIRETVAPEAFGILQQPLQLRLDRREMRDAIRRAAHEMSESIREAAQAARGGNARRDQSGPSGDETRARAGTQPLSREAHQREGQPARPRKAAHK